MDAEMLEHAYDLRLADDPVKLDHRPEHGWCFGRPPSVNANRWPISPLHGTPLRHAFTLKLPPSYRAQGDELVAIAVFVDKQFESRPLPAHNEPGMLEKVAKGLTNLLGRSEPPLAPDPHRFTMEHIGTHCAALWLTEAEFKGPLGSPPDTKVLPLPGWLSKTPAEYFGNSLPVSSAERRLHQNYAPGGYGLDQILAATAPKTGWEHLSALEALDFGWPINISIREGDPNVGKPAREWDYENELSGYVPAYSDEGIRLGLDQFNDWHAHLGGTMFPAQGYPDFTPFYLEFNEVFGGFNFAGGLAQIDLKQMQLAWAR